MRKLILLTGLIFICTQQSVGAFNKPLPPAVDEVSPISEEIIDSLVSEEFQNVFTKFDENLATKLTQTNLKNTWHTILNLLGNHISNIDTTQQNIDDIQISIVTEKFELGELKLVISYNEALEVIGLNMNYSIYPISSEQFNETVVKIGSTDMKLEGILTIPNGVQSPPVVLLVHGEGPLDKNETIYVNTPFKDIAHGLANYGIATLRYDKRTFAYPLMMAQYGENLTLREEVLDDVYDAIKFLEEYPEINSDEIFVLGHSLGAMLTPAIAAENSQVVGIISMAGSLRPLYEISYNHHKFVQRDIFANPNMFSYYRINFIKDKMAQIETDINILRQDLSNVPNERMLLGLPAGYQKSIKEYQGLNFIDDIDIPILVLHGVADYQIPFGDFELYQQVLANKDNVTFRIYPNLNHLFMFSTHNYNAQEYQIKNKVADEVINDIANWILN
ncbi:MAG: hypothetical protein BEN18_06835 [Epulopiscium sp. Nuni2H_MBin001]|nr:MAG: hypothetical protein BEN18_06835 [Epulopiscium sp. Nuni2H_MBin001]